MRNNNLDSYPAVLSSARLVTRCSISDRPDFTSLYVLSFVGSILARLVSHCFNLLGRILPRWDVLIFAGSVSARLVTHCFNLLGRISYALFYFC
jgi:hypothetical protein